MNGVVQARPEAMIPLPPDIALRHMHYDPARAAAWEQLLAPEERQRMLSFKSADRRRGFLLGRVAARTLLAERLALAPPAVPLTVADDGAVEVEGEDLHLSIAHSGAMAVAAAGPRRLGADLEQIAPRHPGVARFMLHPDEFAAFEALPLERERAVILCWTIKEAVLKALRTGFRLSPKRLRLDVDVPAQCAVVHVEERGSWAVRFEEVEGYYLAVAYEEAAG